MREGMGRWPIRLRALRVNRKLVMLALSGVLLGICFLVASLVCTGRQTAYQEASRSLANISAAVSRDIERNVELYDLSLRGVVERVRDPAVMAAPAELRQMILFDRSASAEYLGAILVLDHAGNVQFDSQSVKPRRFNYVDRDYFQAHVGDAGRGLYVSRPLTSKTDGQPIVALSRRLDNPDGSFAGVVVGTLRLSYFRDLYARMHLAGGSSMTLFGSDGTIVMRTPYDASLVGRVLKPQRLFDLVRQSSDGEYEAVSVVDGVERLYHYHVIDGVPLVQNVAMSLEHVYSDWWRRAVTSMVFVIGLCLIVGAVTLLLLRELRLREAAERSLFELSERDELTGLANRRRFDRVLTEEWARARRHGTSLALLMIDADQFKALNDELGHVAGDQALAALGRVLKHDVMRPGDLACRYGGEEFAIILPETPANGALAAAEWINQAVMELEIAHPRSAHRRFTVSIGVAALRPRPDEQIVDLVAAADEALYRAKREGRNRCVLGHSTAMTLAA